MAGKVFGVDLETLIQRQKTEVPKVVLQTIEYLHNKKAHLEEGLFRIPGNNIKITQLKKQFDTGNNVDLNKHNDLDVHTVACLLKMYLRELPVPVIIPRYYSTYLKVYQNPDPKQRLTNFRKLVLGLPKANRVLLITTMEYLHLVAANQPVNKMSTLNLALIFAPNLMRAEKETLTSIMEDADKVAGTLQALIQEVEYFATGKPPAWFTTTESSPLTRAKSNTSPAVPRALSHPVPLHREESISAIIHQVNAEASTAQCIATPILQGSSPTDNSTAETTSFSVIHEASVVSEASISPQPVVEACGEKEQPDSSPQLASPITESEVLDPEVHVTNEAIPLSESVLVTLSDITELVANAALSPRGEGPTSLDQPQTDQDQAQEKPTDGQEPDQSPNGRQALTSSLGTDSNLVPKKRIRSLSSYLRSASDTSLLNKGNLKQPDERLIAKSVKNMKALRASCDLSTDKPRRRMSIISERKKKNQVFSSHPQLKSFVID
jgi:hypothetical protein